MVTWRTQKNFVTARVFPDASFTILLYGKFHSLPISPTMSEISVSQAKLFSTSKSWVPISKCDYANSYGWVYSLWSPATNTASQPLLLVASLSLQNTCSMDRRTLCSQTQVQLKFDMKIKPTCLLQSITFYEPKNQKNITDRNKLVINLRSIYIHTSR